jgi:transcriptional regulator
MPETKSEVMYGTLDLIVLKALETLGPLHGFGLAERIHQVSRELLRLNQGTLYASLARLEQSGCISSKWGTSGNNRKARYYSITRSGRRRLAKEAEDWERMAEFISRLLQGAF